MKISEYKLNIYRLWRIRRFRSCLPTYRLPVSSWLIQLPRFVERGWEQRLRATKLEHLWNIKSWKMVTRVITHKKANIIQMYRIKKLLPSTIIWLKYYFITITITETNKYLNTITITTEKVIEYILYFENYK